MGKLEDKTAVVTGGGSGIGRAIAKRFAEEGAHVVIVGRKEGPLQETAAMDGKISYVVGDITKTETIENIIRTVAEKFHGQLDILVNNAGWCPVQPITELTIEDYDRAFSLDVRALVNLTIHALPLIRKSKGNIINLSSVGATHRAPNLSMYVGAKAAVENFTRVWAMELAADGVRVNAIAPGAIRTNIWNVTDLSPEAAKKHEEGIAAGIPFGRFGMPEEVANVAAFLASAEAGYVSGAIYAVDGASGAA
ncbi:MAG: SDR family oxidoreductase [Clostridiales bacterium]|nr:SDR family oxidoreductase [Clostridiales bacterium]